MQHKSSPPTTILLVDDQPANLTVLEAVLGELGPRMVSVTSGEAALREVLAHDIALILMDVRMPAMDGFETAALMRAHPRSAGVPIIFLTAATDPDPPLEQAYALGAVDFLTKPVNPLALRAKVAVFIDLYRKTLEVARHQQASHLAALRTRDERIRLILDNTRDYAFIGTGHDGGVTEWEGGAENITGWWADSARGQSIAMIYTPEDRAAGVPERELARARDSGSAEDRRWHVRRDGTRFFADGVMVPLRDDEERLRGYAKIFRDATAEQLAAERLKESQALLDLEQKRAEDALRRVAADLSEADRRKSEFLATLAHELRNPLAPIRTGLDLMRMPDADPAARARVLEMMDRQLGHLIHLVNDLLDVARITRGKIELKREPALLGRLVSMALETSMSAIEAAGHRLTVEVADEQAPLEVDVTRIVQVLSNILNNAAKYTPPGGSIEVKAICGLDAVVVAVSDSGVGIPPEAMGTLFDMFTQVDRNLERSQGGLGIGLSLVRRLVELHGGSVDAASAGRDQGSTFTVRLPLGRSALPSARQHGQDARAQALRILVVDDNADAAESLAALLELQGHATRVAHGGRQGLEMAQSFLPQLAFVDIGMPDMNGHEVARAIRASAGLEDVLLVALTGWGAREDVAQSVAAGFDLHLTKPIDLGALDAVFASASRLPGREQ